MLECAIGPCETAWRTVRCIITPCVFVFCLGGPGPSEQPGGGPLTVESKTLGPGEGCQTAQEAALRVAKYNANPYPIEKKDSGRAPKGEGANVCRPATPRLPSYRAQIMSVAPSCAEKAQARGSRVGRAGRRRSWEMA